MPCHPCPQEFTRAQVDGYARRKDEYGNQPHERNAWIDPGLRDQSLSSACRTHAAARADRAMPSRCCAWIDDMVFLPARRIRQDHPDCCHRGHAGRGERFRNASDVLRNRVVAHSRRTCTDRHDHFHLIVTELVLTVVMKKIGIDGSRNKRRLNRA